MFKRKISIQSATLVSMLIALLISFLPFPSIEQAAGLISEIFVNLLKLVSLPLIFLSLVSTAAKMDSAQEAKNLGARTIKYTLSTTLVASLVGLLLYLLIDPSNTNVLLTANQTATNTNSSNQNSVWFFILQIIPKTFFEPFLNNNVFGVLFLAMMISAAILSMPSKEKAPLASLLTSLFTLVTKLVNLFLYLLPVAVGSFVVLFVKDIQKGNDYRSIGLYILCVVAANLVQGLIVLPSFLKWKGISPVKLAKDMWPALTLAFFTKSSAATLPCTIQCAEDHAGVKTKISRLCFPMCSTLNMNACAAFILVTVLYVSEINGISFSIMDMIFWVFIATVSAIGNAAVPMGCYFLASSYLASQNVPLQVLGIILPIYTVIDMLETALNVWSDSCIVAAVDKEC